MHHAPLAKFALLASTAIAKLTRASNPVPTNVAVGELSTGLPNQ